MHLAIEPEPEPEDVRWLEEAIYAFNVERTGLSDGKLLAVFLRDANGSPIGGLYGWTWGTTCYVRYLFIPEPMRGQGYGSRLMALVESEAKARGCRQIALETHDFQAPAFYQKLGFTIVGRIADYPLGHQYLTMVKRLSA
jgi:GNAT superfamily N-acetyltransferase